jgi:type I restriction enzyme S subunit
VSRIEDLIAEFCPDGVDFVPLGELGRRNKGTSITAGRMKEIDVFGGPIRLFAAGATVATVEEGAIPDKDVVRDSGIVIKSRGYIGLELCEQAFSHKSELWSYTINQAAINQRFVYYFLLTQVTWLQALARSKSVKLPQLAVTDTDYLRVPVPPREVQEEIVRILDAFTKLEAELEAELEARRKQFSFFRDGQFSFTPATDVHWSHLGEIAWVFDGTHQTPMYTESGIKFVSVENIRSLEQSKKFISEDDFEHFYKNKPQRNDLLMTRIGSVGACAIVETDEPLAFYVSLALVRPKSETVSVRYIKYFLESQFGVEELRKRTRVDAVPLKINLGDLGKIKVPVIPLEEQEFIVSTLSALDELAHDISLGLPAELAARRKQYEYYRDKLLTFPEKVSS